MGVLQPWWMTAADQRGSDLIDTDLPWPPDSSR